MAAEQAFCASAVPNCMCGPARRTSVQWRGRHRQSVLRRGRKSGPDGPRQRHGEDHTV